MTITICSVTFKPLLLVLTSVCLCVQALGNSASRVTILSEQQKEDQAYIEAFRAFASKDRFVLSIRRYQGTDQVIERKHAVTLVHRLLTIIEYTYVNTKQATLSITDFKNLPKTFFSLDAIPSITIVEGVIEQMYKDIRDVFKDERTNVLQKYYCTVIKQQMGAIEAIDAFVNESGDCLIQKNKLANHILPFMRQMYKYDEAIDYITREHQSHCVKGVVQEYRSHYRVLWWNSLRMRTGAVNVLVKQENVRLWTVFMATACSLLDNDHDKQESMFRDLQSEAQLNFEDYDKVLELPSQMESLLPEMTMVKGLKTSGELIESLVDEFNRYSQKSESSRVEHNDHLWNGYQKKFIVQQTIIRVMRKDLETAQTYLKEQMSKFKEWIENKGISANAIPEQTVALVWTALSQSDTFQRLPEPTKLTILESVLMLMFEHNSVTFPMPKVVNTNDALKNVKVNFPSKLRIFCEFCQDANRLSTGHLVSSKAMDKLVGFYVDKMNKNSASKAVIPDSLTSSVRNRRLTEVVTMILPQLSAKFGQVEEENVTKGCCSGVVNCAYEHPYCSALILGTIVAVALYIGWSFFTDSTIPSPTFNTSTTTLPSNHWFPPTLTNVLIIVMIVLICVFLFMIYQHRKNQSRSTSSKAEKKKNKSKRKVFGKHIRGPEKRVRKAFKSQAQSSAAGSSSSFLSSASTNSLYSSSSVASSASSAQSSVINGQSSAVSGGSNFSKKVSKHARSFKLSPQVGKSPRGGKSPPPDTKHKPKPDKRKSRKK